MARENPSPYGLKVNLNVETSTIEVDFERKVADGDNEVLGQRVYDLSKLHADVVVKNSLYGLSKILQDRTSSESKTSTRLEAMDEVFARLCEGHWEKEREAGTRTVRAEVEALAALHHVSIANIQKELKRYSDEDKEKIFASEAVQEKTKEVKAQRDEGEAPDLSSFLQGAA